MTPYNFCPTSS